MKNKDFYKKVYKYIDKMSDHVSSYTSDRQLDYLQEMYNTGKNVEKLALLAINSHVGMGGGDVYSDPAFPQVKYIDKIIPELVRNTKIAESLLTGSVHESPMQYLVFKTVLEILKTNEDIGCLDFLQQDMREGVEEAINVYNEKSLLGIFYHINQERDMVNG